MSAGRILFVCLLLGFVCLLPVAVVVVAAVFRICMMIFSLLGFVYVREIFMFSVAFRPRRP